MKSDRKPLQEGDLDGVIGLSRLRDLKSKDMDWNSRLTTSRGGKIDRHVHRNNYEVSTPDGPSYYSNLMNMNPDVLDIYL